MVRVEDDGDAVSLGDGTDMVCGGDGANDRGLLLVVREALASEVCRTSLRGLNDDWGLDVPSCFKDGVGYRRRSNILWK